MDGSYREQLANAIRELLPGFFFSPLSVRGNTDWTPQRLTWSALLVGVSEQQTLRERFSAVCKFLKTTCSHWRIGTSYDGWVKAQQRELPRVLPLVIGKLREHMSKIARYQTIAMWIPLGVDGSDGRCPRTQANQDASSGKGQKEGMPLLSMTVMHHLLLGLPWAFRVGPSSESERSHLEEMLDEVPSNALIVADAGFPGYACCRNMIEKQRHFLLRVGGNMHLLKDLGYDLEQSNDIVYLWSDEQQKRKQPPLKLRLIVIHEEGKRPIYLITSVLNPDQLTLEHGRKLYHARWGVEVFYRDTKQTLGHDGVLSRTPSNCYLEMTWAILSAWVLKLMTVRQLVAKGLKPQKISVAKARDAVRRALRNDSPSRGRSFSEALANCSTDNYQRERPKASRNYPRKKRHKPPEPPHIKSATKAQRELAQQLTPLTIA